jgi:hypothetical protein
VTRLSIERARWKRPLIGGIGIVVLAYSANAWFNHTTVGLGLKSHEGAYVLGFSLPFGVVLPGLFLGWVVSVGSVPARRLGAQLGWRDASTRWRSGLMTLVASSVAFGFFHLTYPAPWNTISTCLGLSVVWAGVALVFLVSRRLEAAIVFNNVMAVVEVRRRKLRAA